MTPRPHEDELPSDLIFPLGIHSALWQALDTDALRLDLASVLGLEDTIRLITKHNDAFRAALCPPSPATIVAHRNLKQLLKESRPMFRREQVVASEWFNRAKLGWVCHYPACLAITLAELQRESSKIEASTGMNPFRVWDANAGLAPHVPQTASIVCSGSPVVVTLHPLQQCYMEVSQKRLDELAKLDEVYKAACDAWQELMFMANHYLTRSAEVENTLEGQPYRRLFWQGYVSDFNKTKQSFDRCLLKVQVVVPPLSVAEGDVYSAIPASGVTEHHLMILLGSRFTTIKAEPPAVRVKVLQWLRMNSVTHPQDGLLRPRPGVVSGNNGYHTPPPEPRAVPQAPAPAQQPLPVAPPQPPSVPQHASQTQSQVHGAAPPPQHEPPPIAPSQVQHQRPTFAQQQAPVSLTSSNLTTLQNQLQQPSAPFQPATKQALAQLVAAYQQIGAPPLAHPKRHYQGPNYPPQPPYPNDVNHDAYVLINDTGVPLRAFPSNYAALPPDEQQQVRSQLLRRYRSPYQQGPPQTFGGNLIPNEVRQRQGANRRGPPASKKKETETIDLTLDEDESQASSTGIRQSERERVSLLPQGAKRKAVNDVPHINKGSTAVPRWWKEDKLNPYARTNDNQIPRKNRRKQKSPSVPANVTQAPPAASSSQNTRGPAVGQPAVQFQGQTNAQHHLSPSVPPNVAQAPVSALLSQPIAPPRTVQPQSQPPGPPNSEQPLLPSAWSTNPQQQKPATTQQMPPGPVEIPRQFLGQAEQAMQALQTVKNDPKCRPM